MQMKTMGDICPKFDTSIRWLFSIGFLRCPFAFICSPQNDANNWSSSCFRVSSFSFFFFFCQYTHHTHKTSSPQLHFSTGHIYLYTFSRLSYRYLVLSGKHDPSGAPAIRKLATWLVRATVKAWSRSFRGCVLRCKTNVSIIVKDTNSNYHSNNNGRNVYMRNISMSNKCIFGWVLTTSCKTSGGGLVSSLKPMLTTIQIQIQEPQPLTKK